MRIKIINTGNYYLSQSTKNTLDKLIPFIFQSLVKVLIKK
jgi:hypothetical protein